MVCKDMAADCHHQSSGKVPPVLGCHAESLWMGQVKILCYLGEKCKGWSFKVWWVCISLFWWLIVLTMREKQRQFLNPDPSLTTRYWLCMTSRANRPRISCWHFCSSTGDLISTVWGWNGMTADVGNLLFKQKWALLGAAQQILFLIKCSPTPFLTHNLQW